jgi:Yip1 domain
VPTVVQPRTADEPVGTLRPVSLEREWWLRVLAVLVRPRLVFLALRNDDEEDMDARQEPVLLVTLLAGIAVLLLTPSWGSLYDEALQRGTLLDGLDLALLTLVTGCLTGVVGYYVVGGALYLGARGMGSLAGWRFARHVVAFACVPLAASVPVLLPLGVAAFGKDRFRDGGSDSGAGGTLFLAAQLVFVAWSLVLLLDGVRIAYEWSWQRAVAALALFGAVLALLVAFVSVI